MRRNDEIEKSIKDYFSTYSLIQNPCLKKFFIENENAKEYCEEILREIPEYVNVLNVVKSIAHGIELKKCITCGRLLKFGIRSTHCSISCGVSDKDVVRRHNERSKATSLKKYGVENYGMTKECHEKMEKTCLEKYGVKNYGMTKECHEKMEKTCLEKYGVENPLQYDPIKKKAENTCLSRYGHRNPYQVPEFIEKIQKKSRDTCTRRYGHEFVSQSDGFREMIRNISKERFGFDHYFLAESWKHIESCSSYVVPMFNKEEWKGFTSNAEYEWKCLECGSAFKCSIHQFFKYNDLLMPRCLKCHPHLSGESDKETELLEFCQIQFPDAKKINGMIRGYQLDIVIPEIKLAIEFNGSYWHSMKEKNYHLMKTRLCNEIGYRLIHIWEDEWDLRKEEIKKKLIDIFEGHENLNFTDDTIKLDRSWYNNVEIPKYSLKKEMMPELIDRNGNQVENCGYLIYEKV